MKKLLIVFISIILSQVTLFSQSEFGYYDSSKLIYKSEYINKFKPVINFLNSNFPTYKPKSFYSIPQTEGHYISVTSSDIQKAIDDINTKMSFDDFIKKYKEHATFYKNLLLVKHTEIKSGVKNYTIRVATHKYGNYYILNSTDSEKINRNQKGRWLINVDYNKDKKSGSLQGYYFIEDFKTQLIPPSYQKYIAYSQWLLDTTGANKLFYKKSADGTDILSELEQMNKEKPVGECSMDLMPRAYEYSIANLALQYKYVAPFLQAHLNLLNDNFKRAADGSYAFGDRYTYINELDSLNINSQNLLLGTLFISKNVSENFYQSYPSRLGRAFSESKVDKSKFEQLILSIITDKNLDNLNRQRALGLYESFLSHNKTENKKLIIEKLKTNLPKFIVR